MRSKTFFRLIPIVLGVLCLATSMRVQAAEGDVSIDQEHFPDAAFQMYVSENFDQNHDNILSVTEAMNVTKIDVGRYDGEKDIYTGAIGAKDLTGLEYFPKLQYLYCVDNQITELDLAGNPELILLQCEKNRLTRLNVSGNPKLKFLYAGRNRLSELNISNNPYLESVSCYQCYVRNLDVSKNNRLMYLNCGENQISNLNISNLPELETLYCESNRLKELIIRFCPDLTTLRAQGNQILVLDARCQGEGITDLKVDKDLTAVIRSQKNLGWYHISDAYYWVEAYGDGMLDIRLAAGWRMIRGHYYYFLGNGKMCTGWRRVGGKYYYMNEQGAMLTGWRLIGGKWFCFGANGAMQIGWMKSGGKWYYLNSDGTMAADTTKTLKGKIYRFNKDGVCINP